MIRTPSSLASDEPGLDLVVAVQFVQESGEDADSEAPDGFTKPPRVPSLSGAVV